MQLRIAALVLGGCLALGGCGSYLFADGTDVGHGRYYSSGKPDYDEFFLKVYRLQVDLKESPDNVERLTAALGAKLGLAKGAGPTELRAALAERVKALGAKGTTLRLQRDVGGGMRLEQSGNPTGADAELLATLGQAVTAIDAVRDRIGSWQRELDVLPARGIELERTVDEVFRLEGRGKRGEVRDNLADAQKVMGLMRSLLKDADARSERLSEALIGVVGAGAPPPPPPPPEPDPEPAADPDAKPRPRAAPARRGPGAASRPAPAQKAPSGGDAPAPAPKPVQGTAKPDFEP